MTPHAQTTLIVLVVLDMVISLATTLVCVLLVTGSKRLRPGSGVGSDGESDLEVGSDPPDAIHPTAATMDTLAVFMIAIVIPVSFLVALLALLLRHLQYDDDSWEHCKQV
ncbi:hypothetical protein IWZ01DRAFT_543187 [Phyllosticta capitalensis]